MKPCKTCYPNSKEPGRGLAFWKTIRLIWHCWKLKKHNFKTKFAHPSGKWPFGWLTFFSTEECFAPFEVETIRPRSGFLKNDPSNIFHKKMKILHKNKQKQINLCCNDQNCQPDSASTFQPPTWAASDTAGCRIFPSSGWDARERHWSSPPALCLLPPTFQPSSHKDGFYCDLLFW